MNTFHALICNTLDIIVKSILLQKDYISVLLIFITIDIVTIVEVSINKRKFKKSSYIKKGLTVFSMLLIVLVSGIIDICLFTENSAISTAVVLFYLSQEGKSIINNAYQLGLPLPKTLINIIEHLDKSDNDSSSK